MYDHLEMAKVGGTGSIGLSGLSDPSSEIWKEFEAGTNSIGDDDDLDFDIEDISFVDFKDLDIGIESDDFFKEVKN